jgi:hypothetical protein
MNKIKYLLLVIIIIFPFCSIQAQSLSLGGGVGIIRIYNVPKDGGLTIYFTEGFQFNKIIGLDFRTGYALSTDYFGFNFGGYGKLVLIKERILFDDYEYYNASAYLLLGINFHFNNGESRTGSGTRDGTYTLPTLGIGIKIGILSLEMLYQKPYPDGLGYTYLGSNQYKYDHNFNAVISFNLGLSWDIKSN